MAADDTEITLGPGKLLGLFFLLAVICGVFFAIGYSLGRSTARDQALNDQPGQVLAAAPPATAPSDAADKPSAGVVVKSESSATPAEQTPASNPQSNLTFYKAVQQNSSDAKSAAKGPVTAATDKEPEIKTAAATLPPTVPAPTETAPHTAGAANHGNNVTGPGTFVVQIAAVTREDDAVALAGALRKKNYNVFVVNNPVTKDKFYHVQVGPFSTMQEADAMKAKLVAEGYNPIIKH
ncbi:MAG: SPOR domain-containing protein [Acidobacteriota bacterium]|nr:SPOR domain-containing protein [Acidobacteriota bacterium]